jgi:hypothetical protein
MEEDNVNDDSTSLEEVHYEYTEKEQIDENDVYAEMSREELVEEDGISAEEAAFMQGYEEAA